MDALVLGWDKMVGKSFEERLERCKTFLKAIDKPSRTDLARICVKEPFRLNDLDSLFVK